MIEAIVFALIVLLASGGGFALGHWFTIRAIAHVQPSVSSMPMQERIESVSYEDDPFTDELYEERPGPDDTKPQDDILSKMSDMGLNIDTLKDNMSGTPMAVAGVKTGTAGGDFIEEVDDES